MAYTQTGYFPKAHYASLCSFRRCNLTTAKPKSLRYLLELPTHYYLLCWGNYGNLDKTFVWVLWEFSSLSLTHILYMEENQKQETNQIFLSEYMSSQVTKWLKSTRLDLLIWVERINSVHVLVDCGVGFVVAKPFHWEK